jgi:ATP:corrinoid adenosyltransferase
LKTKGVICLLKEKPKQVKLILIARYGPPALIEEADLITEMQ